MKCLNIQTVERSSVLACLLALHVPFVGAMEVLKQQPKGAIIFTVNVMSNAAQAPVSAHFDAAMLKSLPQTSFVTKTPWYKDAIKLTGPLVKDVLDVLKVKGEKITAVALNDYKVTIPLADAIKYGAIFALTRDGKELSIRDKGPIWIIYPFDSHPELNNTTYYSRSIWQLSSITVE